MEADTPRENPVWREYLMFWGLTGVLSANLGFEDKILTSSACSDCEGSVSVLDAAKGAYEEALHLCSGSGDSGWYVGGVVGDCQRLMMSVTDFETATFILRSGLVSVFVAEVDFDASELVSKSVQDSVEIGLDQVGEFVVHGDVLIAADLNLHSLNSFSLTCRLDAWSVSKVAKFLWWKG